jgi:endonuclease YncB( thermonuclease family)
MGWLSDDKTPKENKESFFLLVNDYIKLSPTGSELISSVTNEWSFSHTIIMGTACSASFLVGFRMGRINPYWKRIISLQDLSSSHIGPDSSFRLRGKVLSVSDGDTFRIYHVPTIFHSSVIPPDSKLSDVGLPIRVCTIDTPETAKFGKEGQAYGEEAKQFLSDMILNKQVELHILQRDQYGRAVAQVQRGRIWPFRRYMDEEMLKAGLAEVYLGTGAVYGFRGKDAYLQMQAEAQKAKRGMWKLGDERESVADFKARIKSQS